MKTTTDKRKQKIYTALPQIIAVSIKNVLLLAYGMTLGFPTIVIPTLQGGMENEELILTPDEISWISSINLICVPLGCLLSGIVTQPLGRKKSMQLINIPFFAAWLIFHYSAKVEHLYAALCLTGLAGGLLEAPVHFKPLEPHLRGMLSATSSMTIIFGVFCQFLLGTFMYWRTVALVNLAFPILAVILLFLIPESPHWLVIKNRLPEAKKSLAWLRGWTTPEAVEEEYVILCATLGKSTNDAPSAMSATKLEMMKRFATKSFLYPYCLICLAFFLGHFSGMTTLQTFAVQIFQTLKSPIDKYYATLLLGIVELIGSLISVVCVHYIGKRPLTFVSTIGCGICFIVTASYAYYIQVDYLVVATDNDLENKLQWLPTTILITSALLSHVGIRLLPWVLIGECFPTELRGIASGLAGGMGYIFGFAANKVFLQMINTMTLPGTETEGRTLHDIELHFAGLKKIPVNAGVYKKEKKPDVEVGEVNLGYYVEKTPDELDSRL